MKEQEKQIAELMKDKEFKKLVKLIDNTHPFYVETIALRVYDKYQPKLPKDSVVLTADEFAGLKKYAYEKGSKETADKIYKEYLCDILSPEAKEEFAKQFNVDTRK